MVAVIVTIALLGTASVMFLRMFKITTEGIKSAANISSRNELSDRVKSLIQQPAAILRSRDQLIADGQAAHPLVLCLQTSGAADCNHQTPAEFPLYNAAGVQIGDGPTAPIAFSFDGTPCAATSAQCPLVVETTFTANCQGGAATCDVPLDLMVQYQIRQVVANETGLRQYSPKSGQFTLGSQRILGLGAQVCPAGQSQVGTDAFGNLICQPTSVAQMCSGSQVVRGIDANGNLICKNLSSTFHAVLAQCPVGSVPCLETRTLGNLSNSFCFLTRVETRGRGGCRVYRGATTFLLEASANNGQQFMTGVSLTRTTNANNHSLYSATPLRNPIQGFAACKAGCITIQP